MHKAAVTRFVIPVSFTIPTWPKSRTESRCRTLNRIYKKKKYCWGIKGCLHLVFNKYSSLRMVPVSKPLQGNNFGMPPVSSESSAIKPLKKNLNFKILAKIFTLKHIEFALLNSVNSQNGIYNFSLSSVEELVYL